MKRLWFVIAILAGVSCAKMPEEEILQRAQELEAGERWTEAVSVFEKVAKTYPESPSAPLALYKAGIIQSNQLQNHERAIAHFGQVVSRYPEDKAAAQCQFMIGFIYANSLSDTAKARDAYETFLRSYPDHELLPSVQWELKYLGRDINEIPELMELESKSGTGKLSSRSSLPRERIPG